jgi:hypothetical protein
LTRFEPEAPKIVNVPVKNNLSAEKLFKTHSERILTAARPRFTAEPECGACFESGAFRDLCVDCKVGV